MQRKEVEEQTLSEGLTILPFLFLIIGLLGLRAGVPGILLVFIGKGITFSLEGGLEPGFTFACVLARTVLDWAAGSAGRGEEVGKGTGVSGLRVTKDVSTLSAC